MTNYGNKTLFVYGAQGLNISLTQSITQRTDLFGAQSLAWEFDWKFMSVTIGFGLAILAGLIFACCIETKPFSEKFQEMNDES